MISISTAGAGTSSTPENPYRQYVPPIKPIRHASPDEASSRQARLHVYAGYQGITVAKARPMAEHAGGFALSYLRSRSPGACEHLPASVLLSGPQLLKDICGFIQVSLSFSIVAINPYFLSFRFPLACALRSAWINKSLRSRSTRRQMAHSTMRSATAFDPP